MHVNHIDPITGLPGFWAHQTCLGCRQWNNHLVIFAAKFPATLGFQHTDHAEGLSLDTDRFARNSICMTKKRLRDLGPKQNHRGASKHVFFRNKFTLG